jgi:excisionase family DNA binding protein
MSSALQAAPVADHPHVYTDSELAPLLGVKRTTLQQWRCRGEGPPFYRVGRAIRYRPAEVQAWLDARRGGGR